MTVLTGPRIVTTEGWGAGEILLLGALLTCRSLLGSPRLERRMRTALAPFLRGERRLRAGSFGRDLAVVAEKREPANRSERANEPHRDPATERGMPRSYASSPNSDCSPEAS